MNTAQEKSPPAAAGQAPESEAHGAAAAARRAALEAGRLAARFGDWLALIGWGKFFLLALLALILSAALPHHHETGFDLSDAAIVMVLALMMVKVALGSKQKAESRAEQASATAAEEGLKRQLLEAQLKAMQAQVEPHFLFNTLASVDYLIETDPVRASRMQKNLIQYLRAALPQMRQDSSTLGREVALCRSYLEILKVRMDERLQYSINVAQGLLSAAFPPMMLQTLVENAIKHGLEPKPDGGTLALGASIADGSLCVAVADSGLGLGAVDPAARPADAAGAAGTGVGLANVRDRLQALYGAKARLTVEANAGGGTIATIVLPYSVAAEQPAAPAA
jgi:LytS/YehU family sensor histidine kinase